MRAAGPAITVNIQFNSHAVCARYICKVMFKILIPFPTTSINFFKYHLNSLTNSDLSASFYHTLGTFPGLRITAAVQ